VKEVSMRGGFSMKMSDEPEEPEGDEPDDEE
jgi:hypothetical protein